MKTIIIYYSYTEKTKKLAYKLGSEMDADIFRIGKNIKPSTIKAFTLGSIKSLLKINPKIENIRSLLLGYEHIIIMGPIWAGKPAPALNSAFEQLPNNKNVSVYLTSGSGKSQAKKDILSILKDKNAKLVEYKDLRIK